MSAERRSLSRGRGLQSSGRGGAGNIRSPSREPGPLTAGPEDYSDTRGRDPIPVSHGDAVISTGRGGAGNIRSPSRDAIRADIVSIDSSPSRPEERGRGNERGYDQDLISSIDIAHDSGVHSSGRGGLGNISRPNSKSRSRSRDPVNSAGRGGAGNLYIGSPVERGILEVEENERVAHKHPAGMHSTGRGGTANLTPGEVPYIEAPVNPLDANHPHATHSHERLSSGRGGAGNIDRSRSREPGDKQGVSGFLHRVTHPGTPKVQTEVLTT